MSFSSAVLNVAMTLSYAETIEMAVEFGAFVKFEPAKILNGVFPAGRGYPHLWKHL
jgi:hypothetical protein